MLTYACPQDEDDIVGVLQDEESDFSSEDLPIDAKLKPDGSRFANNDTSYMYKSKVPLPNSDKGIHHATVLKDPYGDNSTYQAPLGLASKDHLVPFSVMCKLFEKIQNEKTPAKRMGYVTAFWNYLGQKTDLYPFMRLILPEQDCERNRYGLKDKKLAELYIELIPLPKQSNDAKMLRNWKDPTTGSTATCFSDALFSTLKRKGWSEQVQELNQYQKQKFDASNVSVREVNHLLDHLSKSGESYTDEKQKVFMILLKKLTTATEHKWLSKIILKDMKMHLKHETILNHFHEKAVELYNRCTDLKEVLFLIQTNSSELANMGLRPFSAFKPMLAGLAYMEKLPTLLRNEDVVSETKFDGERVMIHKVNNQIKYFTRNSQDYTNIYAGKFDKIVRKCVTARTCILDGEMLIWSNELGCFREFGHNRTFGLSDENSGLEQFCYVVFDVVYLENKDISTMPLSERRYHLEQIVKQEKHTMEIVEQKRMITHQDVMQELQNAIQNRDEGIILKNWHSPYVPAERKQNWIKLKPDHVDGMGETLDLLIVGGYYGTKFNRKSVSHFLLAVAEPMSSSTRALVSSHDSQNSQPSGQHPTYFYTFCKVGSGYNNSELTILQEQLTPHFIPYEKGKTPAYLKNFKPKSGETPDVWINNPKNSKIIEVKAYEFVKDSDMYSCTYTLRFPRVKRIRDDKEWHECLDMKLLQGMVTASQQKHLNLVVSGTTMMSSKAAKRQQRFGQTEEDVVRGNRRPVTTLSHFLGTDTSNVNIVSTIFKGLEFVVLNCQEPYNKSQIERSIAAHSGRFIQNVTEKTNYILACNEKNIRVQSWIASRQKGPKSSDKDIIHCKWIVRCTQENQIVSLDPSVMIYTSESTKIYFKTKMDQYLDDYTMDSTIESMKTSLKLAATKHSDTVQHLNALSILNINSKYDHELASISKLTFMRSLCAVFCPRSENTTHLDALLIQMQMHGAKLICENEARHSYHIPITHVICDGLPKLVDDMNVLKTQLQKYSEFITKPNVIFVTTDWVQRCIASSSIVEPIINEDSFQSSILTNFISLLLKPSPPMNKHSALDNIDFVDVTTPRKVATKSISNPSPQKTTTKAKQQSSSKMKRKRATSEGSPLQKPKKPRVKGNKKDCLTPKRPTIKRKSPIHKTPSRSLHKPCSASPINLVTPSPAPKPRKTICLGASPSSPDLFATPNNRTTTPGSSPATPTIITPRRTVVLQNLASPELF